MSETHLKPVTIAMVNEYYNLTHSGNKPDENIARFVSRLVGDYSFTCNLITQIANYDFETKFGFLIVNNNTPVGFIMAILDPLSAALNVSYFLGSAYRGHGYMQQAIKEFLNYLIAINSPFSTLIFEVRRDNIASQRALISLGAKRLGYSEWYSECLYHLYVLK